MKKKLPIPREAAYARESANQSIAGQMKVIRKYAKRRGLKILKIYSDGGSQAEPSKSATQQK